MRERLVPILRIACIVLAGIAILQCSRILSRSKAYAQITPGTGLSISTNVTVPTNPPGPVKIPPEIAARVEKIKESQVLGQVMRPPPMALIGIAGPDVILRGPNGQMGIIREGEELAGVKLLRVGVNRILVAHEGKTNELTLFEGIGGTTLLEKDNK